MTSRRQDAEPADFIDGIDSWFTEAAEPHRPARAATERRPAAATAKLDDGGKIVARPAFQAASFGHAGARLVPPLIRSGGNDLPSRTVNSAANPADHQWFDVDT